MRVRDDVADSAFRGSANRQIGSPALSCTNSSANALLCLHPCLVRAAPNCHGLAATVFDGGTVSELPFSILSILVAHIRFW